VAALDLPREPPPDERTVLVEDALGVEEVRRVELGGVVFVGDGVQRIPILFDGETAISWASYDDGSIVVNGRPVGQDLTGLSPRERRELANRRRGELEIILVRDVGRLSPKLVAVIQGLSGERLALAISGCMAGGIDLGQLAGIAARLVSLEIATTCHIEHSIEVDLRALPALPRLRALALGNDAFEFTVRVRGLEHLETIPQLGSLSFWQVEIGDAELAGLQGLSRLRALTLFWIPIADAGLAHIGGLSELRELDLGNVSVGDAGLAHLGRLSHLRALRLQRTRFGDAGLAHLRGLSDLEELDLGRTRIGDAGLVHLEGLTRLRELSLEGTLVSDAGLSHLQGLTQLTALNVANTGIGDAGLAHVRALRQLEWLDLSNDRVTNAGLAHLGGFSGLSGLGLAGNDVDDAGLRHIGRLSRLRWLDLGGTAVTSAGLARLRDLRELRGLSVGYSSLATPDVEAFRRQHPRCVVE
jgi:hypothetical protein